MIDPPKPMDSSKDLFQEMVRYTKEYRRYLKACEEGGENHHGPWQKKHKISCWENPNNSKPYKESLPDDDSTEWYLHDRRYDRWDGQGF